ncbi:aromatic ring-hydroxylating dioxygenase subunit alpha [Parashewanella curva]|uniref:Aromatic ring-hydroxylating dioxygenase subunit alpha n=1 Tax=Parashewanella curva TaxID=2338552 RepID=A0A3L8PVK3_9GAMM|nr:aromatic ring-hydroxylating dioxygenase subunit alpha [Parashewanella curva]RLV59354.1 aromatic ring-hydroxylating dioxygenase subunit alpha [Parashewanella curva]
MNKNDVIPLKAYTDPEWFDLEMKHIFSKNWYFAGLMEDITEPGQYKSIQAGLNSIIIVMGRDHRLRAFHNMCRHKGTQLLRAEGKAQKSITCPYHDWTYDLEGELISVPKMAAEFANLDKSCLGLKRASVDIWRGMLWVHPDENPMSITEWFSPVESLLGPHQVEKLIEAKDYKVVEEINANWKIVVENYIDHYHLAQLHSGTLNMYDHSKAEFGFAGPHFAFWEPLDEEYAANLEKHSSMPLIDHIPKELLGAYVPMLFPGIGLGESEAAWSVFHVIPVSVDKTRVEVRTKVMPASDWEFAKYSMRSASFWQKRITAKYPNEDSKHPLGSADFMQEDIYVCEQQQKSFQSPYFELGPSAENGESPVREHQQVVLEYLKPYLSE